MIYNTRDIGGGYNPAVDWLKAIVGKVVIGAIALAVVAGAISWWSLNGDERSQIVDSVGRITAWTALVVAVPWAGVLLIVRVSKVGSNAAGVGLVAGMTLSEMALLGWLLHWHVAGAAAWTGMLVGGLLAAAYNLLACDWIAEKME